MNREIIVFLCIKFVTIDFQRFFDRAAKYYIFRTIL